MKKILFSSLISFTASMAQAQVTSVYYDTKVAKYCTDRPFNSEKISCLATIKDVHFDSAVVDLCIGSPFYSDAMSCLKGIANRKFLSPIEVQLCRDQSFNSDKMSCLKNATTGTFGANTGMNVGVLDLVNGRLGEALMSLQVQDYGRTQSILSQLKADLDTLKANGIH